MSDTVEPFRIAVDGLGPRGSPRAPRAHPVPRPDRGHGLGVRHADRVPARARRVLAGRVRLAARRRRGSTSSTSSAPRSTASRSTSSTRAPPRPDALPLLLIHGWPGSIVEFLDVIPRSPTGGARRRPGRRVPRRSRRRCPATASPARPRERGWDIVPHRARVRRADGPARVRRATARRAATGARRSRRGSATLDPEHCVGLHLNMAGRRPPPDDGRRSPTRSRPTSRRWRASRARRPATRASRARSRRPSAMALERLARRRCSRGSSRSSAPGATATATPRRAFTRDQLLTNVMLYWVTQTITSSARLYWETGSAASWTQPPDHVARAHRHRALPQGGDPPLPAARGSSSATT